MLSKELSNGMNDQIMHEFASAYLYLSMAAWCEANNMAGAAHWFSKQAQEEQEHALKFFKYVHDRGNKVVLQAIPQPKVEFTSLLDAFEQTLKHEQVVTGLINKLYAAAVKENDYASQAFLQWFVTEQVEEEKNATEIVEALRSVGTQGAALFMVNNWLSQR